MGETFTGDQTMQMHGDVGGFLYNSAVFGLVIEWHLPHLPLFCWWFIEKAGANDGREQTNLQLGKYYKIPKLDIQSHLLRFDMTRTQNFGKQKTPNLSKYDWMLGKTLLSWIGSLVGLEK